MAKVFVGNDTTEPFLVYLDVLTTTSDFFRKALTGEFKEKDGIVCLADKSPVIFSRYMGWLYNRKLPMDLGWTDHLNVYVFGVFVQDNKFCNAVIDGFIKATKDKRKYPSSLAGRSYLKLPPSSPFLKLLVDFWVHNSINTCGWFMGDTASSDRTDGPAEFWLAVAHGLAGRGSSKSTIAKPWEENKCQYQIHIDGEPKCS